MTDYLNGLGNQKIRNQESENVYSVYLQQDESDYINMHCSANA